MIARSFIDEYDLKRFMIKEEVEFVFPIIDMAETGQIDRKALTEWVVSSTLPFSVNLILLVPMV